MAHSSLRFLLLGVVLMGGCPVEKSLGAPSGSTGAEFGSSTDGASSGSAVTGGTTATPSTTGDPSETCGTDCTNASSSGTESGSATEAGSETGGEPLSCGFPGPTPGSPCNDEPACVFGDFCAQGLYECIDETWTLRITHGCGAEVVECEDGPEALNGCDTDEPCDPDGDCLDVLECEGENWVERAQCNSITCPQADPTHGQPCEDPDGRQPPWGGWRCTVDHECGVAREYQCLDSGYWVVNPEANETCVTPVACEDGPIVGDACETEAEVCTYPYDELDARACEAGIWS